VSWCVDDKAGQVVYVGNVGPGFTEQMLHEPPPLAGVVPHQAFASLDVRVGRVIGHTFIRSQRGH
jgi:hypothetical protein